jgi:hypothetical protein
LPSSCDSPQPPRPTGQTSHSKSFLLDHLSPVIWPFDIFIFSAPQLLLRHRQHFPIAAPPRRSQHELLESTQLLGRERRAHPRVRRRLLLQARLRRARPPPSGGGHVSNITIISTRARSFRGRANYFFFLLVLPSDHLRHALTIANLQATYSPGHVARTKYKLSHALRRLPEFQLEADEKAMKAEQLYYELTEHNNSESSSGPPSGEEAFDNLIANFWR